MAGKIYFQTQNFGEVGSAPDALESASMGGVCGAGPAEAGGTKPGDRGARVFPYAGMPERPSLARGSTYGGMPDLPLLFPWRKIKAVPDIMKIHPPHEEAFIIHGEGVGTVGRETVAKRAAELAVINGRQPHEATKSDWDEALRELTGGDELDPQQELLESAPESVRWDPVPGTPGHEAMVGFDDEEDPDGRSIEERLFEEGVGEAEHDQMLEATSGNPLPEE